MHRADSSIGLHTEAEQCIQAQWTNRLPSQILSRIFLIGNKADKPDDLKHPTDGQLLEFQEIIVQVCRHWRTVAIEIPMLWTYIKIDGSYPRSRAALFLARSGNTTPLELKLHMTARFRTENSRPCAERTIELLKFIVENGGITSRWASLSVWSESPSMLLAAIDFIAEAELTNLRTLGLVGDSDVYRLTRKAPHQRDLSKFVMFRKPPPLLRAVELTGIANEFLFANSSKPLVSNLTSLELSAIRTLLPYEGLYGLLTHNLGLESLVLDMRMVVDRIGGLRSQWEKQVKLQYLRRFTLKEPCSATWAAFILMMIDAPGVEEFTLDLGNMMLPEGPSIVARYVASGRNENGELLIQTHTTFEAGAGPIYPALQRLTLGPFPDEGHHIGHMIRHFNTITHLDWELKDSADAAILELTKLPLPCPRLQHLRTHGIADDELFQVARAREQHGRPFKTVEVHSRDWGSIRDSTKEYLARTVERFGQYPCDDNSENNDSNTDGEESGSLDSQDDSNGCAGDPDPDSNSNSNSNSDWGSGSDVSGTLAAWNLGPF